MYRRDFSSGLDYIMERLPYKLNKYSYIIWMSSYVLQENLMILQFWQSQLLLYCHSFAVISAYAHTHLQLYEECAQYDKIVEMSNWNVMWVHTNKYVGRHSRGCRHFHDDIWNKNMVIKIMIIRCVRLYGIALPIWRFLYKENILKWKQKEKNRYIQYKWWIYKRTYVYVSEQLIIKPYLNWLCK